MTIHRVQTLSSRACDYYSLFYENNCFDIGTVGENHNFGEKVNFSDETHFHLTVK